jgi:transposase
MSRIGSLLLEFGIALPTGHSVMKQLFNWLAQQRRELPMLLMQELMELHEYYLFLNGNIEKQDKKLKQLVETKAIGQLLKTIPGIGDMTASLCLANIGSATDFKSGRNMAAWLGLVPGQHSTGGKPKLLGISKRGNKALRTLFIHAARAVMSRPDKTGKVYGEWLINLRATKPFNVVTVALANKLARIAWAVMKTKQAFNSKALTPSLQ